MSSLLPKTVRGRLVLLVVLAFLPSLLLTWYGYREIRTLAAEASDQELLRMAEATASDFERMVDDGRGMLFSLAQIEEVRAYRRPACDRLLSRVLAASPRYTALAVIDPDGYRVCGALPLENPLYLGDRSYILRAAGSHGFAVGDYQVGRITGRPTLGLAYPIHGPEGELTSMLGTTLDLTVLALQGSESRLPTDASYTLSDVSGNVLVRYPGNPEWVGRPLSQGFPRLEPDETEALVVEGADLDGAHRRFAVAPLMGPAERPIGYVSVGRSASLATSRLDRILGTQLSILALSAALLLLATWLLGHFSILTRASAILDAEHRIAHGDLTARTGVTHDDDELGELARGFDEMAERLQERGLESDTRGEPAGVG